MRKMRSPEVLGLGKVGWMPPLVAQEMEWCKRNDKKKKRARKK